MLKISQAWATLKEVKNCPKVGRGGVLTYRLVVATLPMEP